MSLINIGISGLRAQQAQLDVVGQNVTNAGTPGYTRQRAEISAIASGFDGRGFTGAGAQVDAFTRLADEFLISQVRTDTSRFGEVDAFAGFVAQIETVVADGSASLAPALENFFDALQSAANQPDAIPERQLVLSQAQALGQRFASLQQGLSQRLDESDTLIGSRLEQINDLARSIANLNGRISERREGIPGGQLNSLLDERDEQIRVLSEQIGVSVVAQQDEALNLSVGSGQPLVVGSQAFSLELDEAGQVSVRTSGQLRGLGDNQIGGQLGGVVRAQNDIVRPALRELGLIAANIQSAVNDQHARGIDLNGELGGDFFSDINSPELVLTRSTNISGIASSGGAIEVLINDASELVDTDYQFTFDGANGLEVRRNSDSEVVFQGQLAGYPATIEFDGLSTTIVAGGHNSGERFRIDALATAAAGVELAITAPRTLALGSGVRVESGVGNIGDVTARIDGLFDADSAAFVDSELTPPLLVVFRSPDRFDVLDNSDPGRPVPLDPPIRAQSFQRGQPTQVFPTEPGSVRIQSSGPQSGAASSATLVESSADLQPTFPGSDIAFIDEDGVATNVVVGPGSSARQVADAIVTSTGLSASAVTDLFITDIRPAAGATSVSVELNGVTIEVEEPVSLTGFADAINANSVLTEAGTVARSDGTSVQIENFNGDTISLAVPESARLAITDARGTDQILQGEPGRFAGVSVFGEISVVAGEGSRIEAPALFGNAPTTGPADFGFPLELVGDPRTGDRIVIDPNQGGVNDNRNALALADLLQNGSVGDSGIGFSEAYGQLIQSIGIAGSEAQLNQSAAGALLEQSRANQASQSGVNLDEEAANLIRFEQAFNASTQIITVARDIFTSLLNAVS